jgi:hypothetical protein
MGLKFLMIIVWLSFLVSWALLNYETCIVKSYFKRKKNKKKVVYV